VDSKFKNILTLALRPETSEGESIAALMAARRMVETQGLDAMLGSNSPVKQHEATYKLKYTIPALYQHGWMETILKQSTRCGVEFELDALNIVDGLLTGSMVIEFTVAGTTDAVNEYVLNIDRQYAWIKQDYREEETQKKTSWVDKIFS